MAFDVGLVHDLVLLAWLTLIFSYLFLFKTQQCNTVKK